MKISFEINTEEDIELVRKYFADNLKTADDIKKQKKSEYDRQRYLSKKSVMESDENYVDFINEEERNEEAVSPLTPSSPSSSSPCTPINNIPITPYPSSQEAKREEGQLNGGRGELKS